MRKSLHYIGLLASILLLGGCPLLNQFLDAPESAFEGTPVSGEAPLTVLFNDQSEAGSTNITEWQWDFGDGATSLLRNPSHIYTAPGSYTVSLTVTTSVGTHTALRRDYIRVIEKTKVDFTGTPLSGGAPLTVAFTDTSEPGSEPITSWAWNFGDRSPIGAEQSPTHVYTAPGLYTVSLTVTTAAGSDQETKVQYINIAGAPVADFTSDLSSGAAPLTVKFTDASATGTATVLAYTWEFGDGGTSAERNPTHTYLASGLYAVSLTVQTTAGTDKVTRAQYIRVEQGPAAAFSGLPRSGPAPLSVVFTDESIPGTQAITRRQWDFGDGGLLSTLTNPTRVYTAPGRYDVSLRVTSTAGTDTEVKPAYVTVTPGVTFSASPSTGKGSVAVQFTDQSALGGFPAQAYAWSFGDGGASTVQNPTHTYGAPGVYDVSLAITTELGESVLARPGLVAVRPDTEFSAAPATGAPPLTVTFKDETLAGAVALTGWRWNFGDGGSSTEQHPTHAYTLPGRYTVALQTTTTLGVDSEQKTGLVEVKPVVDFAVDADSGQGTLVATFADTSITGNLNVLGWHWDFGDGASSTAPSPTHTYSAMGTYDVALTITTVLGDERVSKPGFITVAPRVDFTADQVSGDGALAVAFTDKSDAGSLEIASWLWAFGDGATSDEQHPRHDFGPGVFDVGLTITTSQGETSTVKEQLILVKPEVTIGVVQPAGPAPFEASLLDLTQLGAFTLEGRLWEFGDGGTSDEKDPVHVYEDPGKYTVKLTLRTNGGEFSKTVSDYITAQRGPTAAFSHTVIRGGAPADPVTVSYVSLALPGDAPILNQEWDFGESAIATEEAATEANPTVTYPGTLFDTIPQDVSLTVRTVIAENTLLKENLFDAPVAKSLLPEATLDGANFTAITTDASGDIWAIGAAESPLVLRLGPTGAQRWGQVLDSESALHLRALHAPGDGTVYVAGDIEDTAWIGRFSAGGELLWEVRPDPASSFDVRALTTNSDGTVLCAVATESSAGASELKHLTLSSDGRKLKDSLNGLPIDEKAEVQVAASGDGTLWTLITGPGNLTELYRLDPVLRGDWSRMRLDPIPGLPLALIGGDDEQGLVGAFRMADGAVVVRPLNTLDAVLTLEEESDALITLGRGVDGIQLGGLRREKVGERWSVFLEPLPGY